MFIFISVITLLIIYLGLGSITAWLVTRFNFVNNPEDAAIC